MMDRIVMGDHDENQLKRMREISNIIEAIDDTDPMFGVYGRLKQLVQDALADQEVHVEMLRRPPCR
ncbi:MAG: hypothetical protein AAF438_06815 [Pseudomonadota bacterium]